MSQYKTNFAVLIQNRNGKEILDFLEDCGYDNKFGFVGTAVDGAYYYIRANGYITAVGNVDESTEKYTLEELKEELAEKPTINKLILSNGKTVFISKDKIIAAGNVINVSDIESILKIKEKVSHAYYVRPMVFSIGCWDNITRKDLEEILKIYNQ